MNQPQHTYAKSVNTFGMRDPFIHGDITVRYGWLNFIAALLLLFAGYHTLQAFFTPINHILPILLLIAIESGFGFWFLDYKRRLQESDRDLRRRLQRTDKRLRDMAEQIVEDEIDKTSDHIS